MTKCRIETLPLGNMWVRKFTDWVRPMQSQKSFAAMPVVIVVVEITAYEE